MATLLKYRRAGDVLATEVTEKNLDDLAEMAHGSVFTGPERTGGARYLLLETAEGTQRADLGDYLVQHGEGRKATFTAVAADEFTATYTRP